MVYFIGVIGPFKSVHQIHFLALMALLSILLNASKGVEQFLIVTIVILGVVPIFGWINTPEWFNPLQLIIAVWFCVAVFSYRSRSKDFSSIFSLAPSIFAPLLSFQWWRGMSEGDAVSVLTRILPVWDLSGHFLAFYSNLSDNTYIPRKAPPGDNLVWAYREYPTGIHYVWAQFAKGEKSQILKDPESAIPIFTNSVIVTLVLSTLIASFAVWRLIRITHLRIAFSIICSGVSVALITLGPLSQTITTGFANIPPIVIAISIFLSFALRPHTNKWIQLLILGSSVLCMAYNWYPTLLLIAPALLFLLIQQMKTFGKRHVLIFVVLLSPFVLLPILQTLTLGISHIEQQGGVQPFPSGLLITFLLVVFAIGLWANAVRKEKQYLFITVPAPLLTLVLAVWLRIKTDTYPYYFHKATLFIAAYSIFTILFIVAKQFDSENKDAVAIPFGQKVQVVVAASLLGFGASQMFGYWGFDYSAFSGQGSAYGVLNRNEFLRPNDLSRPTALLIINQARAARQDSIKQKSCLTLMIPAETGMTDKTTVFGWKGPLENIWFHALSDSLTTEAQQLAFSTALISQAANDVDLYVDAIMNTYNPATTCVITSPRIKSALRDKAVNWKSLEVFTQ